MRVVLAVALSCLGVGTSIAAEPAGLPGVVLSLRIGNSQGQVGFVLANRSASAIEFLGSMGRVPVLAYNPDKLVVKGGCVDPPDLPEFFAYSLKADATLSFEYTDPSEVNAFGAFVREPSSTCWHLAQVRRS